MSVYLQLEKIEYGGPNKKAEVGFHPGVNVICGASETGKSFLAQSIDFMLGGSSLKEIPERVAYSSITLTMSASDNSKWKLTRAIAGGDFELSYIEPQSEGSEKLRQSHSHDRVDNLSGFLLAKIGLLGKRILKSAKKGTTVSLSFRNLARLIIVQEWEIQQAGSPFWGGQFTLKTAELATLKLLLTGIDDASIISKDDNEDDDSSKQIALLDELIADLNDEIADKGAGRQDLSDQIQKLENSITQRNDELTTAQNTLTETMSRRREAYFARTAIENRSMEISELLTRFDLLREHYKVDHKRLLAISESGSLFTHVEKVICPLCGAFPEHQHVESDCDGNIEFVVAAANSEIAKVLKLSAELVETVLDLKRELETLSKSHQSVNQQYELIQSQISNTISPQILGTRAEYNELIDVRTKARWTLNLFEKLDGLQNRKKLILEQDAEGASESDKKVASGIPEASSNELSKKVEAVLKAWNFPGDCRVHFNSETSDFVIDGKPRGSRGKGLRAITHAAVTIALLEYCQEHSLPHPGFVVLDSPLLAYFKPEGDEDAALQGTDLKERFYSYLNKHHRSDSQILIIENQHPPEESLIDLNMTVFTRNPSEGRFGLL